MNVLKKFKKREIFYLVSLLVHEDDDHLKEMFNEHHLFNSKDVAIEKLCFLYEEALMILSGKRIPVMHKSLSDDKNAFRIYTESHTFIGIIEQIEEES